MDNPQDIQMGSSKSELQFATSPRRISSWIPIILVSIGIIILIFVVIFKYINKPQTVSSIKTDSTVKTNSQSTNRVEVVVVDVSGAVVKPGVYELPNDSRIQDVLISAGGLDPNADRNYVSKVINLAQKVVDGQKLYIPFMGDPQTQSTMTDGAGMSQNFTGLISLNSASASQLDTLIGVGPVTAQKIISGRPYVSTDELVSKKIMTKTAFDKIKDKISL